MEVPELLTKGSFDLIITDLKMPGMDGMELLELARKHDKDALIFMVTTCGSLESAEEAVVKGAFDYLSKPFRKERLLLATDRAMRWREMALQVTELQGQLGEEQVLR
jgi:DNA-binding NtrC family response regulator